jgi:hypothetical protein
VSLCEGCIYDVNITESVRVCLCEGCTYDVYIRESARVCLCERCIYDVNITGCVYVFMWADHRARRSRIFSRTLSATSAITSDSLDNSHQFPSIPFKRDSIPTKKAIQFPITGSQFPKQKGLVQ